MLYLSLTTAQPNMPNPSDANLFSIDLVLPVVGNTPSHLVDPIQTSEFPVNAFRTCQAEWFDRFY